jgi:hypothetical protein
MPLQDIAILTLIVSVFVSFGATLGWVTWYCSDNRKRASHRVGRRDDHYPSHPNLMMDDD